MADDSGGQSNVSYFVLGGLLVLWISLAYYFFAPAGEPSPAQLEQTALTGAALPEREKAAVKLATLGAPAREHMRRLMAQSKDVEVRAAALQGLGVLWDYESMDTFLSALSDESPLIRGRAGILVPKMIGLSYEFQANDPPVKREAMAKDMASAWKKLKGSPLLENWKKRLQEQAQTAAPK